MGGNTANLVEEIKATKTKIALTSEAIITAHATFTSLFNTFISLSEQLDSKFKDLELKEAAVQQWEDEVKKKDATAEAREKKCEEREHKLEVKEKEVLDKLKAREKEVLDKLTVREKEVLDKEKKWLETEKRMQQNYEKLPTVVQVCVSGQRFAAPKEIFLKYKGSVFEQMVTSNYSQQLPATGEIFIGRDPKYFRYVFNFLLNGSLPATSNERKLVTIAKEFLYFNVPIKFEVPWILFIDGLVDESTSSSWLPKKKFSLLYKASRDGFEPSDFHKHCDNKGPTLTLIRSAEGYLFGGFTPLHWDSAGKKFDSESFIFTLTNPHNIPPTKYPHNKQEVKCAIFCWPSFGPVFGYIDFYISGNRGYSEFPSCYTDSTGKGQLTLTGTHNFEVNEIEVFSVR